MPSDEYVLDVLFRLREGYRRRVEEGDPGAGAILTAIEQCIEKHEKPTPAMPRRGTPGCPRPPA